MYVETVHCALPWNLVTRLGNWMNFNPCYLEIRRTLLYLLWIRGVKIVMNEG